MNPVQKVLPRYSAAVIQVKVHGTDGVGHAQHAYESGDWNQRLDHALRSYNSFDHAATASEPLPLDMLLPGLNKYRVGYEATKKAVAHIVASGAVPGARQLVGTTELAAARDELTRGVELVAAAPTRHEQYRAMDFVGGSIEDASTALKMIGKSDVATPLLSGLRGVRTSMRKNEAITPETVKALNELFDKAQSQLATIDQPGSGAPPAPPQIDKQALAAAERELAIAANLKF